ncbi:hypothetical protein V8G54_030911 [Vigna mungo]|uniref:Uncharacterized protein n=1 Tax=Vigna mungo TaxID=3915 RepID=A0AAQ3MY21_VIGMU
MHEHISSKNEILIITNIDAARTDSTPCVFDLLAFFPFKSEDAKSITASKLPSVAALQEDVPPLNVCAFTTLSVSGSCCFVINEISSLSFNSSEGLTPTGRWKMLRLSTIGVASAAFSWAHFFATSNPGPRFQFSSCSL